MGNIVSYLKWRGDIGLAERPFCDVDNLVLSELAYLDFAGIVPAPADGGSVLVSDVAERLEQRAGADGTSAKLADLVGALVRSTRFRTARLSNYVDVTDESSQTQFSALHVALDDGTTYVAFRGTGDEIVGWREDFSMSYQIMPAQRQAADYLAQTMTDDQMRYRVGGHSKGGNLAVYAAICCPEERQDQIVCVYSNDGPGLCPELIDVSAYQRLRHKVVRICPDFCLIGKLFEQDAADLIVRSSVYGAGAHEGFTWEVEGDQFVLCEDYNPDSLFYNDIFDTWIVSASMEQRLTFTRDFFDALEAGGAKTISELTANGMDGFETTLIALVRSEPKTKVVIGKFLQSVVARVRRIDLKRALRQREMAVGVLLFFIGLSLIAVPELAAKSISVLLGCAALLLLGRRILSCVEQEDPDTDRKKIRLVVYMLLMCVTVTLMNHVSVLSGFSELLLSAGFLWLAYREAREAVRSMRSHRTWETVVRTLVALVSVLFGILPATTMALSIDLYALTAGTFVLIYGVVEIERALLKEDEPTQG